MGKTENAWEQFLTNSPDVLAKIDAEGLCEISADSIKKFREPRLMTKHDSKDSVPKPLADRKLNVLANTRHSYMLGHFNPFEEFPEPEEWKRPIFYSLPPFETLRVDDINSESNAINALLASGMLDHFLEANETTETFNGRMTTNRFEYSIRNESNPSQSLNINVNNAQLEIDGGFENDNDIIIMEAKNVIHSDFNVRQLYYPFRRYQQLVKKPIRLVFSQYTNLMYHLYEYRFDNPDDFNSIKLLRRRCYTFDDDRISQDDIAKIHDKTKPEFSDNYDETHGKPPFLQADNIERVFSLLEFLSRYPDGNTKANIAKHMDTVGRQAGYYTNAGIYLGLFENKHGRVSLTEAGRDLLKYSRRERYLKFAEAMFKHQIFHDLYKNIRENGVVPSKEEVKEEMVKLNVLEANTDSTLGRRAQTIRAWINWLYELADEEE